MAVRRVLFSTVAMVGVVVLTWAPPNPAGAQPATQIAIDNDDIADLRIFALDLSQYFFQSLDECLFTSEQRFQLLSPLLRFHKVLTSPSIAT